MIDRIMYKALTVPYAVEALMLVDRIYWIIR